MSIADKLKDFSHLDQVKFALFCAKQVVHLNSDTRVKAALSAAEAWVEDPSEDNRLKCKEATYAAYAAAAYAATYAAWAADAYAAADAAAAAAAAADAAADATAWVADAAAVRAAYWTTKANPELTEEGLFSSWLMSLVIGDN
jgi:hypothetical protein